MTDLWKDSQQYLGKLQEEVGRLSSKVLQHDMDIPRVQETVRSSVSAANSLVEEVGRKMEEFQDWVNYVTPRDVTSEIPREMADSLNEIILEKTHTSDSELVNERVEHIEGLI